VDNRIAKIFGHAILCVDQSFAKKSKSKKIKKIKKELEVPIQTRKSEEIE
jgi:hypothetical protein